jgi:hypothetical protein
MDQIDALFDRLKANTKTVISTMPADDQGEVVLSTAEMGLILIAASYGLAISMGASRDQLERVAARCLQEHDSTKIIC